MAGFQVANFSFGKNIKDDERQRAIAAMNNATTRRGQDIQAAQADANRAENARQFDERQAAVAAAQEENARQFDETLAERGAQREENARQFDETQALKEQEYKDKRDDITRAQSWDDAIKMQQMEKEQQEIENRRLAFEERNAKLESFLKIKDDEDRQMQNRRAAEESSYGNMAILAQLQNGVVTRKQVDAFNQELIDGGMLEQGREYNYIGTIDQTTGKPFSDNKLHFVRYALDGNGRVQMDPKSGRPLVEVDNPLNAEIRNSALTSYFGDVKEFMSSGKGGGMSEERMQLERDRLAQRKEEESDKLDMREKELAARRERSDIRSKEMKARLAASMAKNSTSMMQGMGIKDEKGREAFKNGLYNILNDVLQFGGEKENPQGKNTRGKQRPTNEEWEKMSREEKVAWMNENYGAGPEPTEE